MLLMIARMEMIKHWQRCKNIELYVAYDAENFPILFGGLWLFETNTLKQFLWVQYLTHISLNTVLAFHGL